MAVFDRVISLWKSEDLLSQAWEESFEMMVLSNEMFSAAIRYLRRGEKIKTLKNLKKRDREINEFQKSVRKKVVTHFSVSQKVEDFPSGLVLLNIVVDVERLGDYTKNILDLAIHYPDPLVSEDCLSSLKKIEDDCYDHIFVDLNDDQFCIDLAAKNMDSLVRILKPKGVITTQVGSQDKKPQQVENWLNVFNQNFGNAKLSRVYIPSFDCSWNFSSSINH